MELKTDTQHDIVIVTPDAQRIDAENVDEFKELMEPILEGNRHIVLNLKHTEFMDSSAMGVVLYCVREVSAVGGEMAICSPSETIRTAFDLIRMGRMVDIYDTREEACASLRQ